MILALLLALEIGIVIGVLIEATVRRRGDVRYYGRTVFAPLPAERAAPCPTPTRKVRTIAKDLRA